MLPKPDPSGPSNVGPAACEDAHLQTSRQMLRIELGLCGFPHPPLAAVVAINHPLIPPRVIRAQFHRPVASRAIGEPIASARGSELLTPLA
ncbi:hypothetical protein [Novipirellula galeiformis]|uniref:hypothetical protein n=1 Tax=Novipirellula galeiformis TaxID=2528004 RepID=UPI0011B81730|nr:hypothetical protein [Novipirellula galeiformis]